MAPTPRLRPLTFYGRVPYGVTNVEVCKELVKKIFEDRALPAVQEFQAGRFEITFKTARAVQKFLDQPVLDVRGTEVRFAYRGILSTTVRVFGLPVDTETAELRVALGVYGAVEAIVPEFVPGVKAIENKM